MYESKAGGEVVMTFDEFMQSPMPNLYVKEKGFTSLYVRKGPRYIDGVLHKQVIQLASIETRRKGQGTFTAFVNRIKEQYPEHVIYVECVHNPRLGPHLLGLGFSQVDEQTGNHFAVGTKGTV
jgi:hypothetical protein